jgi:quercetin dioxygenase-like cupin family protein
MTIGHLDDLEGTPLAGEDLRAVVKKILVSPADGWSDHVMRVFELGPGGYTPRHAHDWFHVNYVIDGQGVLFLGGVEHPVKAGSYAFVPAGAEHQFRNAGEAPFRFICIVPEAYDQGWRK